MPKITLLNTESGKLEDFEPVDANEILSSPETIYSVPQETRDEIGKQFDASVSGDDEDGVNVPQLHDAEMQTGLSVEKYGRSAVVLAQPGLVAPAPTAERPQTTSGKSLREDGKASDGLTMAELRQGLEEKGIEYPSDAKKADLQALYNASQAG